MQNKSVLQWQLPRFFMWEDFHAPLFFYFKYVFAQRGIVKTSQMQLQSSFKSVLEFVIWGYLAIVWWKLFFNREELYHFHWDYGIVFFYLSKFVVEVLLRHTTISELFHCLSGLGVDVRAALDDMRADISGLWSNELVLENEALKSPRFRRGLKWGDDKRCEDNWRDLVDTLWLPLWLFTLLYCRSGVDSSALNE